MPPGEDQELDEARAFAVKAVVTGVVSLPFWLTGLHFLATLNRIDFTPVREVEMLVAAAGVFTAVITWAFKGKR